jgi:DNA-binding NarL/FixJ family response regulator
MNTLPHTPLDPPLNIAIINPRVLVRVGFGVMLETWRHGRVVLEAENGADYEQKCTNAPPIHLAVVDLDMPERDGYSTIGWIVREQPGVIPVALSVDTSEPVVQMAVHAGARAVLPMSIRTHELHTALEHLASTGFHMNELMERCLKHHGPVAGPDALRRKALELLSPRELEFLLIYIQEDEPTQEQIALKMKCDPETVETYRKRVVEKTGARGRTCTLHFAQRFGLV